ncbi:MAG: hypothetical protein HOV81_24910 [Kofleriaceae bacterium]|nr:hypothetical protein [Kofleriaceae bacterium]
MSFGIIEVITLIMGLSGFSVGTNPKSPTADQALEYAVPDADVIAHFDAGAVIPGNYKVLTNLANQPQIKASPELAKMVRKAVAEIDGPRGLVKQTVGIDLTTDVSDATAFVKLVPKQDPNIVVAVHGKFSVITIDKIAKMTGKGAVKSGAGAWVDTGDGNAVAVTKNGVLLAGTSSLVKDRMADTWKAPGTAGNANLTNAAEILGQKPVFALVLTMSQTARAEALKSVQGQNFATDVLKRHKFAAFAVFKDGVGWTWIDSSKTGLDAMTQISDGFVDLLRAAQIAPRGFAKILMGGLESYRGTNKQVDDLLRHKADVLKIVDSYTGDGKFQASVNADSKSLKLTVRLTGKSVSEVLPMGGFLPLAGVFLFAGRAESTPPTMQMPAPAPLPPPPAKKSGAPAKHP